MHMLVSSLRPMPEGPLVETEAARTPSSEGSRKANVVNPVEERNGIGGGVTASTNAHVGVVESVKPVDDAV